MTDRELLEAAARAAGIEVRYSDTHKFINEIQHCKWNPLSDDGDALRLAVKLCLNLYLSDYGRVEVDAIGDVLCEDFGTGDPAAATRRAIVRAAAQIGEKNGD